MTHRTSSGLAAKMSGLSCPLGAHGIQSRCLWDATQPSQFSFVVEAIKQVVQVGVSEILGRALVQRT